MNVLIVDDERLARTRMKRLLDVHPDVVVVDLCDSVASALGALEQHRVDVIFLDIAMPGQDGFDLLESTVITAHVVFVTAHDDRAIRAFEVGAVDYILKPIDPERLGESLDRLRARATPREDQLVLSDGRGLRVVSSQDILWVRADGDYSHLVLADGTELSQKRSLGHWETRLGDAVIRVHRGHVVRLSAIAKMVPAEGSTYVIELRGLKCRVPVSRGRAAALREALQPST